MAESDDLRQFISDIANRHDRIWREQAKMYREQSALLREQSREIRKITTELRDTRGERRAHTRALLQVLDRLEGGGAQA
jgi:uncharacterized coiled-coil DUF342 family protein